MRRIAVFSTAGGAGKTTTVMNLAATLAERGKRVLAVDLDPGSRLLRAFARTRIDDLLDVVERGRPLAETVRPTPFAGIFLLNAGLEVDAEERLRRLRRGFERRVAAASRLASAGATVSSLVEEALRLYLPRLRARYNAGLAFAPRGPRSRAPRPRVLATDESVNPTQGDSPPESAAETIDPLGGNTRSR
ncbi:MAG: ParA family protein [Myxococcota bacterium]|jgi:hypothetical protein|nr:ParA family protein [Myxococcota bacterium]